MSVMPVFADVFQAAADFYASDSVLLGERHTLRAHGNLWVVYDKLGTMRVIAHELFAAITWFVLMEHGTFPLEPFAFVADRPDTEVIEDDTTARTALWRARMQRAREMARIVQEPE